MLFFMLLLSIKKTLTDAEIIARANAQSWNPETDEDILNYYGDWILDEEEYQ